MDTGFWLALASRKDRHHKRCTKLLDGLEERLITTWPVITETCHLLTHRVGSDSAMRFIDSGAKGAFEVHALTPEHFPRMHALMHRYRDLPMDLADASLVLLAEELGTGRILSTDQRDFGTYRFKNHKPFENLLA